MLTFEQIKELIELVGHEKLQGLEIERSGFRLKIDGNQPESTISYVSSAPPLEVDAAPVGVTRIEAAPAPPSASVPEEKDEGGIPDGAHVLHSPIVGTFYSAPNPELDPFVRPGDRIQQGQVLCIVEAMKLMNEIEADVDGVVTQILPKNAQPVEFGEPLFVIDAD